MIEFNEANKAKMLVVAEALRGTCGNLEDALQNEFGDVEVGDCQIELLRVLDDTVMECEECGWWCETHEFADQEEQVCADCAADR